MIGEAELASLRAEGIEVGSGGPAGWTEFVAPNGNPCASYDAEEGVVVATCRVAFAPRSRILSRAEDPDEALDTFVDEADDAFEAEHLPRWEAAGWSLVDVEDMSADSNFVFLFATLERACATAAEVCDAVRFAAAHEEQPVDV
ncbi:MAG: hypothetical protein RLZZ299_2000 [Pseudomonadota bacterium]|jgi:hypothetical protein